MASIELINVGAAPNDGAGDPIRTAFEKVNENFVALNNEVANGAGAITNAINVGSSPAAAGVFLDKDGSTLRFKKLVPGSGITLGATSNEITISSSAIVDVTGEAGSFLTTNGNTIAVTSILRYDQPSDKIVSDVDFDLRLNRIGNVANPSNTQDVATKSYVDSAITGVAAGVTVLDNNLSLGVAQRLNFIGDDVILTNTSPNQIDIAISTGVDTAAVQQIVGQMFTDNLTEGVISAYSAEVQKINLGVTDFNINLTGAVNGTALVQGFNNDITIETTSSYISGVTVSKDSVDIGSKGTVKTLNFAGSNLGVTRVGDVITVTVAQGLTDADVRNEIGTTIKGVTSDPLNPAIETESGITTRYVSVNNTMELGVRDFNISLSGAVTGSGTVSRLRDLNIVTTTNAIEGLTLNKDGLQVGLPSSVKTLNFTGDNITATRVGNVATISVSSLVTGDQVSSVLNPRMLGQQDGLEITFDSLNKIYNYRINPITINLAGAVSGTGVITFDGTAVDGNVTINTTGGGGGAGVTVADEGNVSGQASTINFVGGGITTAVSLDGTVATVYVPNSPAAEPFITATPGSENIPNARLLTAGTGVIITDSGPGGSITISANNDAILAKSGYSVDGSLVAEQFGINFGTTRWIVPIMENDVANSRVNLNIYYLRDAWYRLGSYDAGLIIDNEGPALDFGPLVGGILETTPDLGFID